MPMELGMIPPKDFSDADVVRDDTLGKF